ncbi:MAG: CAP domain-containing protein [Alphaproteobacteria bacterium]
MIRSYVKPAALSLIAALALAGCAEIPLIKSIPVQQLPLGGISLNPESARRMINSYRQQRGLRPLTLNNQLTLAARRHATDLAKGRRISHKGSDGSDPWTRIKATGYKAKLSAENVGAGQRSFSEVLQGWKKSSGHNRNLLLPDAVHMGIALEKNPNSRFQTFWTLVLGTPSR